MTFPGAAGKFQVSVGGGTEPRWRDDGKEMFSPQSLFHMRARAPLSNTDVFSYDVVKDGSRFIVNRYVKPSYVTPLGILLNATAGLPEGSFDVVVSSASLTADQIDA